MVGVERFELPTLCSQSRCATRLRYTPRDWEYSPRACFTATLCPAPHLRAKPQPPILGPGHAPPPDSPKTQANRNTFSGHHEIATIHIDGLAGHAGGFRATEKPGKLRNLLGRDQPA